MGIILPVYSQGDPRWGNNMMRPSPFSMASLGCLVTAIAMGLKNYAINTDPGKLCDALVGANAFDVSAQLATYKIQEIYPQVSFIERTQTTADPRPQAAKVQIDVALKRIQRFLNLGNPVYINVDLVAQDKIPDHWVVAYDPVITAGQLSDFKIHDPAFGEDALFSKRYGSLRTGVYGFLGYVGPGVAFPDGVRSDDGVTAWKISQANRNLNRDLYTREALEGFVH